MAEREQDESLTSARAGAPSAATPEIPDGDEKATPTAPEATAEGADHGDPGDEERPDHRKATPVDAPPGSVPFGPPPVVHPRAVGQTRPQARDERAVRVGRSPVSASWRTIGRVLAPRATRAQLTAGLLSLLLGFAIVVQVQANRTEGLSSLRQDELVRILDEVTQQEAELEEEAAALRAQRAELVTGTDTRRAAREAALRRAEVQGILAGTLPAVGPGIELVVREPDQAIPALTLYNLLEELRNAGVEAVQVDEVRLTASSYFADSPDGVIVDGVLLEAPYRWLAIGDPDVVVPALSIPGGALAEVTRRTGVTDLRARDEVEVSAVRELPTPRYALPVPAEE